MKIKILVLTVFLFFVTSKVAAVQIDENPKGFWTFGTAKEWSATELDNAFAVFIRLKKNYGEQFNLVIQDLQKEGASSKEEAKTSQVAIKIYVSPPSETIENELRSVGLVYVRMPSHF